ncbi:MAG: PAS domain-containing protein [Candidatus Thorarchaeota archaeon]|nr:PAS domain-containing protein [Candidatus Thorarchaeota archaeon]
MTGGSQERVKSWISTIQDMRRQGQTGVIILADGLVAHLDETACSLIGRPAESMIGASCTDVAQWLCTTMGLQSCDQFSSFLSGLGQDDTITIPRSVEGRNQADVIMTRIAVKCRTTRIVIVLVSCPCLDPRLAFRAGASSVVYRDLFERNPAAIWEEDFSATKLLLDRLQLESPGNIRERLQSNPDLLDSCVRSIRVIRANRAAAELQGVKSPQELIGSLSEVLSPEGRVAMIEELALLAEGVRNFNIHSVVKAPDGVSRNVRLQISVPDEFAHTLERVLVTMYDISDLISLERELQRDSRAYAAVAEAASSEGTLKELCERVLAAVVQLVDHELGVIRRYDRVSESLVLQAAIGFRADEIHQAVSVNDDKHFASEVARTRQPKFVHDSSDYSPRMRELGVKCAIFWPVLKANGKLWGVLNLATRRDRVLSESDRRFFEIIAHLFGQVIERKTVEEQLRESQAILRSFADATPGPVFIKDNELRLLFINEYMRRGVLEETWIGKTDAQLLPARMAQRSMAEDKEVLAHGARSFEQMLADESSGGVRYFKAFKFPIHVHGRPPLLGGFSLDITKERMAEKRAEEARSRAEFLLDLIGHDLNNMHQGIMTGLELMLRSPLFPSELRDLAESSLSQVTRSISLIDNVRKFALVDRGTSHVLPVDPYDELQAAIVLLQQSFPDQAIALECGVHSGEFLVLADGLLKEVFYNLLHNAVKVSPITPPRIRIVASKDEAGMVEFRFEDWGPGMSDALKSSVFTRLELPRGSGMGLTLVKRIIDSYAGQVWAEDRVKGDPSQGTSFVVKLRQASS